jgi:hypothetical protein
MAHAFGTYVKTSPAGRYVIVANVALADSCLRLGARVVVLSIPGNPDRVRVRGLSRGGRRVTKYTRARALRDVRVAWEYDTDGEWLGFPSKEAATVCIAARLSPYAASSGGGSPNSQG